MIIETHVQIEFVSETDKLPSDEILQKLFNKAYSEIVHGSLYVKINLDDIPY